MKQFKAKSEGPFQIPERHNLNILSIQRINENLAPLQVSEEQGNTSKNIFQTLALGFRRAIIHKDPITLYRAAKAIRMKLSENANLHLENFLGTGLISNIVKLLDPDDKVNVDLQFELICIISNACSGNTVYTSKIVTRYLIETILRFIWHPEQKIVEMTFWVIRHISGSSAQINSLIQQDALSTISKFTKKLKRGFTEDILRLESWIFHNISTNYNSHEQFFKYDLLGLMQRILELNDKESCSNACRIYSRLIQRGDEKCIAAILTPKFIDRIFQLLEDRDTAILDRAIQTIINILSSGSCYRTKMYSAGCLDKLEALLEKRELTIQPQAIRAIQKLVSEPNLLAAILERPLFANLFNTISNDTCQREAIICLANALYIANQQQVESLVKLGLIKTFPTILSISNSNLVVLGLGAIEIILQHGLGAKKHANPYTSVLEKEGVVACLAKLRSHCNPDVDSAVRRIFETYF